MDFIQNSIPQETSLFVTHSMGNLILAEAVRTERYEFAPGTKWVSLGAPWG